MGAAKRITAHIEGLLEGVWEELDPEKELVVITSDHGNFEDMSVKPHTENKVFTAVYGKGQELFEQEVKYLYDIPRTIMKLSGIEFKENEDLLTAS